MQSYYRKIKELFRFKGLTIDSQELDSLLLQENDLAESQIIGFEEMPMNNENILNTPSNDSIFRDITNSKRRSSKYQDHVIHSCGVAALTKLHQRGVMLEVDCPEMTELAKKVYDLL